MMKKLKEATVVSDERCAEESSAGRSVRRNDEAEIAHSTSLMFMDAANNIDVQNLTLENVGKYTLRKFNVDVTKNIFDNPKPTTRAEIRAEQRRINANKQTKVQSMQKDSAKRKLEPTFSSSVGGTKKKNIGDEKMLSALSKDEESFTVEERIGENVKNLEGESKMVKSIKPNRRSTKNVKNAIISSKKVKSNYKANTKKKSVGSKLAKRSSKKNVKKTVAHGKKMKKKA